MTTGKSGVVGEARDFVGTAIWICARKRPQRPPGTGRWLTLGSRGLHFEFHGWQSHGATPHQGLNVEDMPKPKGRWDLL